MDWQCSGCGRHFSFAQNECPYCKFVSTVTTGGTQPISDNITIKPCKCVVKQTEVPGLCIIYVRSNCPYHGQFHASKKKEKLWVKQKTTY